MYNLFNITPATTMGVMRHAKWLYLEPCLKRNLDTVINYYRRSPYAVKSQHFLVRLLHALTIPKSQEIERFYYNVDSIALNIGMALGMTSPISKGKVFDGIFYGKGNKEILIADNSEFDPVAADKDWENLEPIRVLRHPRSDLNMNIPNGVNTGVEEGIVVVLINIPMLAVQYRAFRRNENRSAFVSGVNERSIMQFIHMYPLTNMVKSHLDIALFNRFNNLARGIPFGETTLKHSFFLIDYTKELNHFHEDTLESLQQVGKNFYDTLRSIPAVSNATMIEVFKLPDIVLTRQVIWALTIARLPALTFLAFTAKGNASTRNRMELNLIKRKLLEQRTENLMKANIGNDISMFMDVEAELKQLTDAK